ncbi:MAG: hypothetical protein Q9160_004367 [Pyrenula sp. 1 TL-2023]
MQLLRTHAQLLLLLVSLLTSVTASSWGFADATVSVQSKGSGVGGGVKEKLSEGKAIPKAVTIGAADTLKIILTTQNGKQARRPHQAFLLLKDPSSGLDISYPFSVKDSGKAKIDLVQKDLPAQFTRSNKHIDASVVLASFGSSKPYNQKAFTLAISPDPNLSATSAESFTRYGKLPEIHHIFRADPKSPPVFITLFFTAAVLATIPVLFGTQFENSTMGSATSKAARTAGNAAKRQYPKTPSSTVSSSQNTNAQPPPPPQQPQPGPSVHPSTPPQASKNEAIDLDARDPDFASRLSRLGPVQPAPTASHSSTSNPTPQRPSLDTGGRQQGLFSSTNAPIFPDASNNPALLIVQAREQASKQAEEEAEAMGRSSFAGRTLIDVHTIKRAVGMKERGMTDINIEKTLMLRSGLVKKLGAGKDGIIKDVHE